MKRAAFVVAAAGLLCATSARARTPEIVNDPVTGVWIAQDDKLIYQTLDRWTVTAFGATINKMVVDQTILWLATDDGVVRFETGSQRSTRLTMDDGLPSQRVNTVAFDDQYVWFGTNKGLVRYRKTDRTIKVYDETNGLPNKTITYAITIGRQVWFATRGGIAVYNPDVDGFRAFGEADGLASGDVAELIQVGTDLFCRTDVGLSHFRVVQHVFNNFSMASMGAQQIRVVAVDGSDLWLGTDNGLFQFEDASDTIRPFQQQAALGSKMIVGVEPTSAYVFITTDKEILEYNRLTTAISRFTPAQGLSRQEGATGTLSYGGFVTVMFPDAAVIYNISVDMWADRSLAVTVSNAAKTTFRVYGQLDSAEPYNNVKLGPGPRHIVPAWPGGPARTDNVKLGPGWLPTGTRDSADSYANATGGFGFGQQMSEGRTLNGSIYLNYGQLDASGIRDLQYKIAYLGNQNDVVRDVRIEDTLKYRYVEEGLDRQLLLQGAHVGVATPGAEPKATMTVDAGFRRGQIVRDFITGPRQSSYQLSSQYILPGTERVYVDGELLNNGVDYTIVYTAGQLLFLNPERIDDLSVITVEYERDLVPKKSLGTLSPLTMLPVSNEIGTFALAGTPTVVSNDTALYNQIDGGAPKYIDRGWVSSVYATYQQGGTSVQVAIHNMGTDDNAYNLWTYEKPVSFITIDNNSAAVVDMGLPAAYATFAYTKNYVIEVSITDRSDAALIYIQTFTMNILYQGSAAPPSLGDQFKEWMVAGRATASPVKGMEVGARAVELQQVSDLRDAKGNAIAPAMHLTSGVADARYQTAVGNGGLLTSYAEMGGSHDSNGERPDGLAGMGMMRLSSPMLEGTVSARLNSEGWTPIGHTTPTVDPTTGKPLGTWNDARLGTFRDETRFNVTGYPLPWLALTTLFDRQRAWLTDGSGGTGVLQHAIARIQLQKAGLPGTTLQLSSTELDNPNAFQTHRLQGSIQSDYDLAPALSFTHIKKFNIRALYSISDGETDKNGAYAYDDRVQLMRFEGKLSPTATETIFALFRSRNLERQTEQGGPFARGVYHWELTSGARSMIIPGLVPTLSYNVIYDDSRLVSTAPAAAPGGATPGTSSTASASATGAASTTPWPNMGPAGSAVTPPGPAPGIQEPTRNLSGSFGAGLGIYPGQWSPKLGPLAISPSVAVGASDSSSEVPASLSKTYNRTYDFVLLEVWAGQKIELQLYQRYRFLTADEDAHYAGFTTIIQNRIVYRPIFTSPIILLVNYERDRNPNDPTKIPDAGPWSVKETYQDSLQWYMRWTPIVTTRLTASGSLERTSDFFQPAQSRTTLTFSPPTQTNSGNTTVMVPYDHSKYSAGFEAQLRLYPLADVSALYIYQTAGVLRWFGSGDNAYPAWELLPAAGVIWRMHDKMYLDAEVTYDYLYCMPVQGDSSCSSVSAVVPRLYFTMNL
jgi:hypothetical protein